MLTNVLVKIDEVIAEYAEAQSGCPVAFTYTYDEVRELLKGFEIIDMRKAHIFPWKIAEYKQYKYEKEDCWKNVSPELFAKLESELGWHIIVRAKLAKQ